MRTETFWQGERREARMHWWQQVLERPVTVSREALFDEVLCLRFGSAGEGEGRSEDRQLRLGYQR